MFVRTIWDKLPPCIWGKLPQCIWDKLPQYIFENYEIALVKRRQCQSFQNSQGLFIPKTARTKHMVFA